MDQSCPDTQGGSSAREVDGGLRARIPAHPSMRASWQLQWLGALDPSGTSALSSSSTAGKEQEQRISDTFNGRLAEEQLVFQSRGTLGASTAREAGVVWFPPSCPLGP